MNNNTPKNAAFSANSSTAFADNLPGTLSSSSAWKAFQAGMQILQRYAARSPVDIQSVTKSNLQLLHRSLSKNKQYNGNIENIQREGLQNGLPTIRRIYSSHGLTADILTIQKGASIKLIAPPQRYAMYLLLSGSAQQASGKSKTNPRQHWWNRLTQRDGSHHLRDGAVICCMDEKPDEQLTACGKNCLVLRVLTATAEFPREMAS